MSRKLIIYIVSHTLFLTFSYLGFVHNPVNDGLANIAVFYAWLLFAISLFSFSETSQKVFKTNGRTSPIYVDLTIDMLIVFMMVYGGYIFISIIYCISAFLTWVAIDNALTNDKTGNK